MRQCCQFIKIPKTVRLLCGFTDNFECICQTQVLMFSFCFEVMSTKVMLWAFKAIFHFNLSCVKLTSIDEYSKLLFHSEAKHRSYDARPLNKQHKEESSIYYSHVTTLVFCISFPCVCVCVCVKMKTNINSNITHLPLKL